MIDKELFVVGVHDKKSGYKQIWHIDEYKKVKVTYDACLSGAKNQGLDPDSLFLFPFPPDDEVVEKFKLTHDFLKWLHDTTKPIIQNFK